MNGTPQSFSAKIQARFLPRLKIPAKVAFDDGDLVITGLLIPGNQIIWEAA